MVKLHSKQLTPFHRRRELPAILAARHRRPHNWHAERMREIHKRRRRNAAQQTRGRIDLQLVPSHMGRFHACSKALAFAFEHTESSRLRRLLTPLEHPLHSDTNPEKRSPAANRIRNGVPQARRRERCRRGKMADTGKYNLRSPFNLRRIGSDGALLPQPIQRLLHRNQISRAVIHDRDHYSTPLVLGNRRAMRRSRQQAARSAREKALNKASILWWFDRP